MILKMPFPPDIRVQKEARALLRAGHKVHLLCDGAEGLREEETIDGIGIHRVPKSRPILERIYALVYALTFVDLLWLREIDRMVHEHDIDVLHVHDLPLVLTAAVIGKSRKVPLIFDMHENLPALRQIRVESGYRGAKDSLLPRWRWEWLQRISVRLATHVLVVSPELREHVRKQVGCRPDKLTVVANVADLADLRRVETMWDRRSPKKYLVSFCGVLSPDRGLDTLIRAVLAILQVLPQAQVLIVGSGGVSEELSRLTASLGLKGHVAIEGWGDWLVWTDDGPVRRPADERYSLSQASHANFVKAMLESTIGIMPYASNEQRNTTLPHKLFQHMYFETPVLVSDVKPLRRIVQEVGCGRIFRPGDKEDLARQIIAMASDPELQQMGRNGRRAVLERYNWGVESRRLLSVYEGIAERLKRPPIPGGPGR